MPAAIGIAILAVSTASILIRFGAAGCAFHHNRCPQIDLRHRRPGARRADCGIARSWHRSPAGNCALALISGDLPGCCTSPLGSPPSNTQASRARSCWSAQGRCGSRCFHRSSCANDVGAGGLWLAWYWRCCGGMIIAGSDFVHVCVAGFTAAASVHTPQGTTSVGKPAGVVRRVGRDGLSANRQATAQHPLPDSLHLPGLRMRGSCLADHCCAYEFPGPGACRAHRTCGSCCWRLVPQLDRTLHIQLGAQVPAGRGRGGHNAG